MNIGRIIAAILIVVVLCREVKYLRMVVVRTKKAKRELLLVAAAVVVLAAITLLLAKRWFDYAIGACAILLVLADVGKQGLSENGLLVVAKGKQLYRWAEIDHAVVTVSDDVHIDFFATTNTKIVTHAFPLSLQGSVLALLQAHKVAFRYA